MKQDKSDNEKYSKIPNEVIEVLARTHLSSYESRYIWFLLRKTYGWGKKKDFISNSQFVKGTGITKQHIWHTGQRLLWRKIVAQIGNKIGLNKNYAEWRRLPKSATVAKIGIKVADSRKKVAQIGGHKRHYTKETIQNTLGELLKELGLSEEELRPLYKQYDKDQIDSVLKIYRDIKDRQPIRSSIALLTHLCRVGVKWEESDDEKRLKQYGEITKGLLKEFPK